MKPFVLYYIGRRYYKTCSLEYTLSIHLEQYLSSLVAPPSGTGINHFNRRNTATNAARRTISKFPYHKVFGLIRYVRGYNLLEYFQFIFRDIKFSYNTAVAYS